MTILPPRRPSALESRAFRVIGRLRAMRAFERRHLLQVFDQYAALLATP
jgi:hypothetical protein